MTWKFIRKLAFTAVYDLLVKQASIQNVFSLVDHGMLGRLFFQCFMHEVE